MGRATSPAATSCGTSKMRWRRALRPLPARRVGRAEIDADDEARLARWISGLALPDVQLELPAVAAAARDAPQLERADLGDAALERHRDRASSFPATRQRHLERAQLLEVVAPVLDQRARRVALARRGELRNRNSAGSPTTRPNSRSAIAARCPSSMPNGTTHSALSGAGSPGRPASRSRCRRSSCARRRCGCGRPCRAAPARSRRRPARRRDRGRAPRARGDRRAARSLRRQPVAQHLDDPVAERRRLHHAAVEEHVRRARQPLGPRRMARGRARRGLLRAGTARGAASPPDRPA